MKKWLADELDELNLLRRNNRISYDDWKMFVASVKEDYERAIRE